MLEVTFPGPLWVSFFSISALSVIWESWLPYVLFYLRVQLLKKSIKVSTGYGNWFPQYLSAS